MNKYRFTFWIAVICWAFFVLWLIAIPVQSEPYSAPEDIDVPSLDDLALQAAIDSVNVDKPALEPVTYSDWFKANANIIYGCVVTHYCSETYEHICGSGDGVTATGTPVTPYWTCAVDPDVIPYGSEVMVDYGDRVEFYKAQDKGAAIAGNHIDLAVQTHKEAEERGTLTATVYYMEVNHWD